MIRTKGSVVVIISFTRSCNVVIDEFAVSLVAGASWRSQCGVLRR